MLIGLLAIASLQMPLESGFPYQINNPFNEIEAIAFDKLVIATAGRRLPEESRPMTSPLGPQSARVILDEVTVVARFLPGAPLRGSSPRPCEAPAKRSPPSSRAVAT
jgi:hypothetical protein